MVYGYTYYKRLYSTSTNSNADCKHYLRQKRLLSEVNSPPLFSQVVGL